MKRAAVLASVMIAAIGWLTIGNNPEREPLEHSTRALWHLPIPDFQRVKMDHRPSEGLLLARDGAALHAVRLNMRERRGEWVRLAAISPALRATVIAIEDHRFYRHAGVDWRALAAAFAQTLRGAPLRGASTLSMQVAALLESDGANKSRSPAQKWRQMRRAWALERHWRKDEILEAYLNLASFRGELVGIGAASRGLLHKAADTLDGTDSLLLTLLLRAPNAAPDTLQSRGCHLAAHLSLPTDCASLTAHIATTLDGIYSASMTSFNSQLGPQLAPHVARRLLAHDSRQIRSTLNLGIQRAAVAALQRQLVALRAHHVMDGAVLVVDNLTGEVLAYVGNAGAGSSARYVDGVQARRQAGSTLKPFLYALALEQKVLTAASLLNDSPLNLETPRGLYVPQNYDREFKGLVSVRSSLAGSLNIPAVRTLMLVGPEAFLQALRQSGFSGITEDADFYGYALALGATEVSLWELTNAYRGLALGTRHPSPLRSKMVNSPAPGTAIDEAAERRPEQAGSGAAAFIVSDILADRGSRSATFGLENPLATPFWSAVKTGTSKHMRDNWCIGYSTRYTVGVWVGNFNGSPMHEVSGLTGAAPVWAELMRVLHESKRSAAPVPPAQLERKAVKFEHTAEADRLEWFVAGTANLLVRPSAVTPLPRIVYPGRHSILVLDPDIPPQHQRVFFAMAPPQPGLVWHLNDAPLSREQMPAWAPAPGVFKLSLVDVSARALDEIHFTVRGAALAQPAAARTAYIEK